MSEWGNAEQARAGDGVQRPLVPRSRFPPRLTRGVRRQGNYLLSYKHLWALSENDPFLRPLDEGTTDTREGFPQWDKAGDSSATHKLEGCSLRLLFRQS